MTGIKIFFSKLHLSPTGMHVNCFSLAILEYVTRWHEDMYLKEFDEVVVVRV